METPGGGGSPEPQTLAAGELVWARNKGRRQWWPARLRGACDAGSRNALVSCFGDQEPRRATQLRRFADPDADGMARANLARGFLAAVEEAQARAVAILHKDLVCACTSPPPGATAAETEKEKGSVGVANLSPSEFLASLRDAAALDVSSVGMVDRVRLRSWVRAVAQGWGPEGARHYPRRLVEDLVDKIDLDVVPAGDDRDAAGWVAGDEDKALQRPQETPAHKRRSVASLMDELDAGEDDEQKNESGGLGTGLSVKRERKKSKYLSPPYTNLAGGVAIEKLADLPTELLLSAVKDEKKVLPDNVEVRKVLLLVHHFGKDVLHKTRFPKAAIEFLDLLRSSSFAQGANHGSYKEHKCPMEIAFAKTGTEVTGLVSDSCASLKQGKCVLKRTKKKDLEGSGGSSSKRKKMKKTSHTTTLGCGVTITPAIPIRQMRAEDMRIQVKAGGGARGMGVGISDQKGKLVSKSPISAAMSGGIKSGEEQDKVNGGSVVNTPVNDGDTLSGKYAKHKDHEGTEEATKPVTDIHLDINVQSVIVDVPVSSVEMEATESKTDVRVDMNVKSVIVDVPVRSVQMERMGLGTNIPTKMNEQSAVADVPVRSVQMEGMELVTKIPTEINEQSAVADVPVRTVQMEGMELGTKIPTEINEQSAVADVPIISGTLPTHGDISLPTDGNKDNANVDVRTVHESYASLEAMVPEMLNKVEEVTTGTNVIAMSHVLKFADQKDEQPNQKRTADEAIANHSPGSATNGTFPDLATSAPKKKKKRTVQYLNPAEIRLKFTDGVILPSKEELLSAFRKFGFVIESETDILKDIRSARVVFGKSGDAEKACSKPEILGQFGPPFATLVSLNYLPAIELSISPHKPAPKPPNLADMRKNLEDMISSLTSHSPLKKANSSAGPKPVPENLLGQMKGLLSRVDKMLAGPSSSSKSIPP